MKYIVRFIKLLSILLFIELLSVPLYGQLGVSLSSGNTIPLHELNAPEIKPFDINSYALSLSYVPKKIGFGLQLSSSSFKSNQDFFTQFESFDILPSFQQEEWKNKMLFLGPIFKLGGQKFNLEFFPKFGLGKISIPDRQVIYQQGQKQFLLYKDNSTEAKLNGTQLFSGLDTRLNIGITKRISTHIFAGISTNRFFGDGNSTIYRAVNISGNGVTEEELTAGRLLQLDCESYDLINIGLGITFSFFKKKDKNSEESDKKIFPPKPVYPENESKISLANADSLVLEWNKETPDVKDANYEFYLYKKGETQNKDSLIFNTKVIRQNSLELPEKIKLYPGIIYAWKVQAVDARDLKYCSDGCYSNQYEFEVSPFAIPQYFQLISHNKGNHVIVKDRLRIIIDENVLMADAVKVQIFDEEQKTVLEVENMQKDKKQMESLGFGRYELDIRNLKSGAYYLLKVNNSKRNYYLKFYKANEQNDKP